MPLYEYVCKECEFEFEELIMVPGEEIVTCPQCNAIDVKKKISICNHKIYGFCYKNRDAFRPNANKTNK